MICPTCATSKSGRCRSCAQRTPEARLRNRLSGIKGGQASGITRRKHAHTAEYDHGYEAGWRAGRKVFERSTGGIW